MKSRNSRQRGAVLVEAAITISTLTLGLVGLAFFRDFYIDQVKVSRLRVTNRGARTHHLAVTKATSTSVVRMDADGLAALDFGRLAGRAGIELAVQAGRRLVGHQPQRMARVRRVALGQPRGVARGVRDASWRSRAQSESGKTKPRLSGTSAGAHA
mgnify:CR=1 FL=1